MSFSQVCNSCRGWLKEKFLCAIMKQCGRLGLVVILGLKTDDGWSKQTGG